MGPPLPDPLRHLLLREVGRVPRHGAAQLVHRQPVPALVARAGVPPAAPNDRGECANPKKTGPVKKEWQVGRDNDSRSRARTGADGAVVLNLRRGPGAYALLLCADGQLTRAGQHYYSHLACGPQDFDYNQPLIREGPNDYILLGGEHRLTKLGKGFFRDKYYEYLARFCATCVRRRASQLPGCVQTGYQAVRTFLRRAGWCL